MNNLPLIVPKSTCPTILKPRTTTKSRNRDPDFVHNATRRNTEEARTETLAIDEFDEANDLRVELDALKKKHEEEMKKAQDEIRLLKLDCDTLEAMNKKTSLSPISLKDNTEMFSFYTGLRDYQIFKILFDSFGPAAEKLLYCGSNTNPERITESGKKRGPKRSITPEHEFFLVLVRLRCGLLENDIAYRAGISVSHFSRIFITWVDFLHSRFRAFPIWASRETIDKTMPECFKASYPTTRVIIDASEIFIEMPSSLRAQSESYSNYKHHNTAKGLIGVAPSGAITFVSDLYAGRCSAKAITKDCACMTFWKMETQLWKIKDLRLKMICLATHT